MSHRSTSRTSGDGRGRSGSAGRRSSTKQTGRPKLPPPFIPGPSKPGRRLAPAYDLEGPRVRLGVAWFVVVFAALGVGRFLGDFPLVGLCYTAVAVVAAAQIVDVWTAGRAPELRWCAMGAAATVGCAAAFGAGPFGGALLVAIGIGIVAGVWSVVARRRPLLHATALVLQAALPTGGVAASVVLTLHYEIGAAVILLAFVMAYDLGDFLIGSGAGSLVEGPIAGGLMIALVAAVAAIIGAPPFNGALVWVFALGAMVLCPLGQVAASWMLPDATTRAPALRRLDSLLLLGPVWALTAGIVAAG